MTSDQLWAILGQVALVLGLIWTCIRLWAYFQPHRLSVTVMARNQINPSGIIRGRKVKELLFTSKTLLLGLDSEKKKNLRKGFDEMVDLSILQPLQSEMNSLNSLFDIRLRNKLRKKSIKEVSAACPGARCYFLQKGGGTGSWNWYTGEIKMGEFRPAEEARLLIWGTARDKKALNEMLNKLTIKQADGVARIRRKSIFF